MKRLKKFAALLLSAGLVLGLTGCPNGNGNGGGGGGDFGQFYDGNFRGNRNGSVTVRNNTPFDMLLFEGEFLGRERIVGGVRAGGTSTLNFSNEPDYAEGGFRLLRAVRQSEFEQHGHQSRIDHSVMAPFRRTAPTTVDITSTTDGDFQYIVHNMSSRFSLELRENSMNGRVVAFLTRGERNRLIRTSSAEQIILYPVWVGFSTQTMEIVQFAPTEPFTAQPVQPAAQGNPAPPLHFPWMGDGNEINFPVRSPTAVIRVMNTFGQMVNFRSGVQPFSAIGMPQTVTGSGINSGNWRSFNVESGGMPINLNIFLPGGNVTVPVRFEGEGSLPLLENGFYYHLVFEHIAGQPITDPASYRAVLERQGEIDTGDVITSP